MKLLLCADFHGEKEFIDLIKKKASKENAEAVICAGDISWFGESLNSIFNQFNEMELPIFFVRGNHETEEEIQAPLRKNKFFYHLEANPVFFKGYLFMGFGGGGFYERDPDFEIKKNILITETIRLILDLAQSGEIKLVMSSKKIKKLNTQKEKINFIKKQFKNKIIFTSHQPPHGFKSDYVYEGHVGNKSYKQIIDEFEPVLFVCGHIHETAGVQEKYNSTTIINPGWEGKIYKLPKVKKD